MGKLEALPVDTADCKPFYLTDSIIVGAGEVPGIRTAGGVIWALPGGGTTANVVEAVQLAVKLDQMISSTLHRYKRKIMRL